MTRQLRLAPWPKKLTKTGSSFEWRRGDRMTLAPESGDGDLEACAALTKEMACSGMPHPVLDRHGIGRPPQRGLQLAYGARKQFGEEGYAIRISAKGAQAEAATPAGMFYAIQTLRQINRCCGNRWPGMIIEDEPRLRYRGLMICVSQGMMPRPDVLAKWIERMAAFKLNVFQVYMDRGFHFTSHPELSGDMIRYTAEDLLKLDALCARYHIDLQPNWNSFGHQGGFGGIDGLLSHPKYALLAEKADSNLLSLCPTDPRTYRFLADLYADYLPLFRSKFLHVGCDEVVDLGTGRSTVRAKRVGKAALFAEHVVKLHQLAARHGKRIQIWADHIGTHPEILDLLPKDVIPVNWSYEDDSPRVDEMTAYCASRGFETWGSPGVSNWGSTMARHYNAACNIRTHAKAIAEYGGTGLLNTDWAGVGGWPGVFGTGFHGYVLGAAEAWSPGALDEQAFDDAFSLHGLGDASGKAMEAIRTIGRYLSHGDPSETPSIGMLSGTFPKPGRLNIEHKPDYFDRMAADIEAERKPLEKIADPEVREVYRAAAFHSQLGARKARLDAAYVGEGSRLAEDGIKTEAAKLGRDLRDSIPHIKRAWLLTNTPDYLDDHVKRLNKIIASLKEPMVARALTARKNKREITKTPLSVVIPNKADGRVVSLTKFHAGSPGWQQPLTLRVQADLRYDSHALRLKLTGEDPILKQYGKCASSMNVAALSSSFDIFLCPKPDKPWLFGQLIVNGTGRVMARIGAPFTGVETHSTVRDLSWIVDVTIPWAGVARAPRPGDRWRGNVTYSAVRYHQYASWSPVNGFFDLDQFGEWVFE